MYEAYVDNKMVQSGSLLIVVEPNQTRLKQS